MTVELEFIWLLRAALVSKTFLIDILKNNYPETLVIAICCGKMTKIWVQTGKTNNPSSNESLTETVDSKGYLMKDINQYI